MPVTVGALKEALSLLPPELRLTGNQVGNLAVLDEDGDYIGYVDFADGGTVHWCGESS